MGECLARDAVYNIHLDFCFIGEQLDRSAHLPQSRVLSVLMTSFSRGDAIGQ